MIQTIYRVLVKNTATRMTALPTELWLIIFDIVIEEGIIRLDYCDYTTFAYIQTFLSSVGYSCRFHRSYFRLRLVCRRFNAMLGSLLTDYLSHSSSLPFPPSTRTLFLNFEAIYRTDFRRLLAEPSPCIRLVYLDVTCCMATNSDRPDLFDLLAVSGRTFHSVQRLTLRLLNKQHEQWQYLFWTRLHRAFPWLVTLVITTEYKRASLFLLETAGEVATFESLEILYFGGTIIYSGCHFPRLRHASIASANHFSGAQLEVLRLSSHLESLLIYTIGPSVVIDARSFPCLRLLGFMDHRLTEVVPLDCEHPLEHLLVFWYGIEWRGGIYGDSVPFKGILERLPGISRITVDLSLATVKRRRHRTKEFRTMNLASIGLSIRHPIDDNPIIEVERITGIKGGILNKVWKKIRR